MTDRTCILSGQSLPRDQLIRFVAGPDGYAVVDLAEKLPGRGVWVENGADHLRKVAAKNLLTKRIGVTFRDVEAEIVQMEAEERKHIENLRKLQDEQKAAYDALEHALANR